MYMLQGFTPQLRLESKHRIRMCAENISILIPLYYRLFTWSNVNQNSSMASVIMVQIYL